ncbi:MAG: hypothetical protein ACF8TS_08480, partial [Maioricimonas sp. JB049]
MSYLRDGVRHPKIYAYTLEQYANFPWEGRREGSGLIKVGYTELDDAEDRIRGQLHQVKMPTATPFTVLLVEAAITADGEAFKDHDV